MNFLNMNRSKLMGGVLVLVALCVGAFLLFGGLGGGDRSNVPVTGPGNTLPNSGQNQGRLGNMFAARSVDNNGCPNQETTRFDSRDSIFVGLERSQIPDGTSMFARLYQDGRPVEDTDEIVAEQNIDSCVWFEFAPSGGSRGFEPGDYTAEMIVNGNRAGRINFEITGDSRSALPGAGGRASELGSTELGQAYTSTQVDQNGCPADQETSFYADEAVYVAFERSYIPAGTEVFARLNYEGQPVEDTDVIVADRDMDSCFWFVFEPDRAGFNPGNYSVDVFVNGGRAESLRLQVR